MEGEGGKGDSVCVERYSLEQVARKTLQAIKCLLSS